MLLLGSSRSKWPEFTFRKISQEQVGQGSVMNVLALAAEVSGECFKRQVLILFFERFLVFGLVHHRTLKRKKKKKAYFRSNIKEDVEA